MMNGEIKISVVIPVYNVEAYLRRCVDSVLEQTLDKVEIILVDDGSPDSSGEICDQYADDYSCIHVIHKENGGLSSARNAGMSMAKGKYLFFLDSDDWLEKDGLQKLYEKAEEYDVDFVRFRAIRSGWPNMPEHAPVKLGDAREMDGGYYDTEMIQKEIYPRLLVTSELTMGPIVGSCSSLYKRSFLEVHQIRFFENIRYSEDLLFSAQVVRAASSFYYIEEAGIYHYFYNPNSISKSFREGRWESCKEMIRLADDSFRDDEYDFSDQLERLRWFCILLALNERKYLSHYQDKVVYCRRILTDPVIKEKKLSIRGLHVSCRQRIICWCTKAGWAKVIAMI